MLQSVKQETCLREARESYRIVFFFVMYTKKEVKMICTIKEHAWYVCLFTTQTKHTHTCTHTHTHTHTHVQTDEHLSSTGKK